MKTKDKLLNFPAPGKTGDAKYAVLWLVPKKGWGVPFSTFMGVSESSAMKHIVSESSFERVQDVRKFGVSFEIYCIFETLSEKPYKKIPLAARKALYENNSSWPKLKREVKKLVKAHDLEITNELADDIKRVDQLIKAYDKDMPWLGLVSGSGKDAVTKYFDSEGAVINHVLKAEFSHWGVVLGDKALGKFIAQGGDAAFKQIKNSEHRDELLKQIKDTVYWNRWVLPETWKELSSTREAREG